MVCNRSQAHPSKAAPHASLWNVNKSAPTLKIRQCLSPKDYLSCLYKDLDLNKSNTGCHFVRKMKWIVRRFKFSLYFKVLLRELSPNGARCTAMARNLAHNFAFTTHFNQFPQYESFTCITVSITDLCFRCGKNAAWSAPLRKLVAIETGRDHITLTRRAAGTNAGPVCIDRVCIDRCCGSCFERGMSWQARPRLVKPGAGR